MKKMSSRTRNLIILGGVVILALVIFLLVDLFAPTGDDVDISAEEEVEFFKADIKEIKKIQWEAGAEKYAYSQSGGRWYDDLNPDFMVDSEKFTEFLEKYASWMAKRQVEVEATDAELGFSKPSILMTIDTGSLNAIIIGGMNLTSNAYYAKNGDGSVYLVKTNLIDDLTLERRSIFEKEEVPSLSALCKVEIYDGEEKPEFGVEKKTEEKDGEKITTYVRSDNGEEVDSDLAESYFVKVKAFSFGDYYTYKSDGSDLSTYGFNEKSKTMVLTYIDEHDTHKSVEILFASDVISENYRAVMYPGSKVIYQLPNSWYDDAFISYDDLMVKEEESSSAAESESETKETETTSSEKKE